MNLEWHQEIMTGLRWRKIFVVVSLKDELQKVLDNLSMP